MRQGYTAEAVRRAEEPLLAAGRGEALMRTAAAGLATVCRRALIENRGAVTGARVVVLTGPGNNGGDALFAAANLLDRGALAVCVPVLSRPHAAGLAAFLAAGGRVREPDDGTLALLREADLVLDGILGTGARPGLPEQVRDLVQRWQGVEGGQGTSTAGDGPAQEVVAVDVPTGVDATTGELSDGHVRATRTVSFGADKAGMFLPGGADVAGTVHYVDIGLDMSDRTPAVEIPEPQDVLDRWPLAETARAGVHKYTRGVLGLVAGSGRYPGAAVLAAAGAVSTGVGMVRLHTTGEVSWPALERYPEIVVGTGRVQAWAMGPGTPEEPRMRHAITDAVSHGLPIVVDAGGLDLLTRPLHTSALLTPHAGELAALLGRVTTGAPTREQVEAQPVRAAIRAAQAMEATVLLKGRRTIIARPDRTVVAPGVGVANLATAGSGDVLTGMLGSLCATSRDHPVAEHTDLAFLAGLAVLVHARAGATVTHASGIPPQVERTVLELASATLGPDHVGAPDRHFLG
ncbi:bifunctional ADP-dependent NAD(P)H-hydrate dehydratase/NAD(P)H-hydrate epimerase [Brevibacterium litoralis]|uniref:bifunctional ADP-dependent NAD(P)H-hydrate dehydratase/NAD(P)H-hydrate epimerase n=1 Tax=Brevibacterium litoralis TaxID=3138935 RepID=UPI0032EB00EC